jgi:hypothetical protein
MVNLHQLLQVLWLVLHQLLGYLDRWFYIVNHGLYVKWAVGSMLSGPGCSMFKFACESLVPHCVLGLFGLLVLHQVFKYLVSPKVRNFAQTQMGSQTM